MRRRKRIREEAGNPFRFALGILFLQWDFRIGRRLRRRDRAGNQTSLRRSTPPGSDAPPYAPEVRSPRTLTLPQGR